jgi:hypothetical protein
MNIKNNILRTIDIATMDTTLFASSSTQFLLNRREDELIFDCQVSTDFKDQNKKGEPPPHLLGYSLNAKKLIRMEPEGYVCFSPVLKEDTIFCSGYKKMGNARMNIYRMDLSGSKFKFAFGDCENFSCRTQ